MEPESKGVMLVAESLPAGLVANAAGVLAFTPGREMECAVGPGVPDGSGERHEGTTRVPLPVLCADGRTLRRLRPEAGQTELLAGDFTESAQTSKACEEYERKLASRQTEELEYLGLALYEKKKEADRLTGGLPPLR